MATKKKSSKPSVVEDIEHVDVPAQSAPLAVQQPQEVEVVEANEDPAKTLELTIAREIKRFGIADAGIAELKDRYGGLTIADVNDKAGYEVVKKAWGEVRTVRTGLEKKGKDIRSSYTTITKRVKEEEDRLIGLVTPLEEDLYDKWKKVDDEKEAEKQRRAAEAEAKLQERVQELLDAGCEFKLGYYGIGNTIAIDVATLREMPEEQFAALKTAVVAKKREVDEEAAKEAERLRLENEQRDRDKRRLQELENEKAEAAKAKRELRLDLLEAVGMTISAGGKEVVYDNGFADHRIPMERVDNATDAEFKALIAEAKTQIAACKERMAAAEKEKEEERRVLETKKVYINDLLVAAGLTYQYGTDCFTFKNDFFEYTKHMAELVPMGEEALGELAEKLTTRIAEAKDKQLSHDEREAKRKESERQAKLGDDELMIEYLTALGKVPLPELKTEAMQGRLAQFLGKFATLMEQYRPAKEAVPA